MAEEGVLGELLIKLGLLPDKESFEKGDELLDKVKEGLEFFAGFEAIKGLAELVEHTTEAAVGAKHLAERLGTTIEAVQELGYAADVTGASSDDMRIGLQHLTLALQHAHKTGTGPLVDAFGKLRLSFSDPALKGNDLDAKLMRIAEAFKDAGPDVNKTALAMEIFGTRVGPKLIPLLNKGADGISELREEFKALGAETSGETAEALEKLEEDQKKLKYLWGGIKDEAVVALLPALKELVEGLFGWVKANRAVISSTIGAFVDALIVAFKAFGAVMESVATVIEFLVEHSKVGRAVLIALGAAITYVGAAAFGAWVKGFAPVAGVVAAIAGIILVVEDLWDSIVNGEGVAKDVFDFLEDKIGKVGAYIASAIAAVSGFFLIRFALMKIAVHVFGVTAAAASAEASAGFMAMLGPIGLVAAAIAGAIALSDQFVFDPTQFTSMDEARQHLPGMGGAGATAPAATLSPDSFDTRQLGGGGGSTTVDVGGITVNPAPGMDEKAIGAAVADHISDLARDVHYGTGGH